MPRLRRPAHFIRKKPVVFTPRYYSYTAPLDPAAWATPHEAALVKRIAVALNEELDRRLFGLPASVGVDEDLTWRPGEYMGIRRDGV